MKGSFFKETILSLLAFSKVLIPDIISSKCPDYDATRCLFYGTLNIDFNLNKQLR